MNKQILIVEDNITHLRVLQSIVEKLGYKAKCFQDPSRALKFLDKHQQEQNIVCALVDILMPEMNGLEFVARLKANEQPLPAIMVTAESQVETIVEAIKSGAVDFITKPVDEARLKVSIENALKFNTLSDEIERLRRYEDSSITMADLLCASSAMTTVIKQATKAKSSVIPVFLEGEEGVGKRLIAKAIHAESPRAANSFVSINCNELDNSDDALARVFGSEEGTYPVSSKQIIGKIREAEGGTLFIENINSMPNTIQTLLLKTLIQGEVTPRGSNKKYKIDIRLICSSSETIEEKVEKEEFNNELFYKLHVFPIYIPPLRERKKDIKILLNHYLSLYSVMEGKEIEQIEPKLLKKLVEYQWPGNVRQLKNTLYRAVVLSEDKELNYNQFDTLQIKGRFKVKYSGNSGSNGDELNLYNKTGKLRKLKDIEADIIKAAISHHKGHMSRVARDLGIGRSTLYRKLDSCFVE